MSYSCITTICFCSLCAIAAASSAQPPPLQAKIIPRRTSLETRAFVNLYEPTTNVDAAALIDKDVRAILSRTNLGTQSALDEAMQVYSQGAYSASYATLQVDALPDNTLYPRGTVVEGPSNKPNEPAVGFLMEDARAGDTTLLVQYTTNCYVGGLQNPVLNHCFAESNGVQFVLMGENSFEINYTYSPLEDTRNAQTLEWMGEGGESHLFAHYFNYSGTYDYANQVMKAAFQGTKTAFPNSNVDFDFSNLGLEGRAAAIGWGVVGMNVWSEVAEKLHKATTACNEEEATRYWDEAVALYTGSITTFPGTEGYLLFTLAEEECPYFGTCSEGQMAHVNEKIFGAFLEGKKHLKNKHCHALEETSQQIESLMKIPLVQRVLRHAYAIDNHSNRLDKTQGLAAAFAASLAPHLYVCQRSTAHMVWKDLQPGNAPGVSFELLKLNLERVYDCLGITCEDVGGLVHGDPSSGLEYFPGAEPCGYVVPSVPTQPAPTAPTSPVPAPTVSAPTSSIPTAPSLSMSSASNNNNQNGQPIMIGSLVGLSILLVALVSVVIRLRSRRSAAAKTLDMDPTMENIQIQEEDVAAETGEIA